LSRQAPCQRKTNAHTSSRTRTNLTPIFFAFAKLRPKGANKSGRRPYR
jgi:hypothetical protein